MPARTKKLVYTDQEGVTYKAYYNYISGRLSEKQRYTPQTEEKDENDTEPNDGAVG